MKTDLLQIQISYRGEVYGVSIMVVIWMRAQVHEQLDNPLESGGSIINCNHFSVSITVSLARKHCIGHMQEFTTWQSYTDIQR